MCLVVLKKKKKKKKKIYWNETLNIQVKEKDLTIQLHSFFYQQFSQRDTMGHFYFWYVDGMTRKGETEITWLNGCGQPLPGITKLVHNA